jgi:serine acetyltransferase
MGDFRQDRARYGQWAWISHRALWAVGSYRFARCSLQHPMPVKLLTRPLSVLLTLLARITTNIEIPSTAEIGPGLFIKHAGPIVVHARVKIGRDCAMGVGVVVGASHGGVPVIGDRVLLSTYSVTVGAITVGDDAKIGAKAFVTSDVPAGCTAVGTPARIV